MLTGSFLAERRAQVGQDATIPKIQSLLADHGCCLNFVCNRWESISRREHVLGVTFLKAVGVWVSVESVIGKGNMDANDCHNGIATAK
jgi:hypothetical protein